MAQDLTRTNRSIVESFVKNEGFPVHMGTTSYPHYVKGKPDMVYYSLEEKKLANKI